MTSESLKEDRLLRTAAIYGPNASGKTNIIKAMDFLKRLVVNSHNHQKGTKIIFQPFKLDKKCLNTPSQFEVVFIKNNVKYIYGLSVSNIVHNEYLYHYPKGKKALIFERTNTSDYKFPKTDERKQRFLADKTLENILYISRATQLNYDVTAEPFKWFKDDLHVLREPETPDMRRFTAKLLEDEESKKLIMKALKIADLGIDDITAEFRKVKLDELTSNFPEDIRKLIPSQGDVEQMELYTKHGDQKFDFELEESEGTKKYFSLIGPWIDSLRNGFVIFVDELDTKLHHNLIIFLIQLFQNDTQNIEGAQLVFTTHNVNLLDQNIFRRDQIWLTDKSSEKGNTDLYSILEFSPRKDKNLRKGYLAGRYGALPYIKNEGILSDEGL